MFNTLFYNRQQSRCFPKFLYTLTFDMFCIIQYWEPLSSGFEKGRVFEEIFYNYCRHRRIDLTERSGSRTIRGQRSASGFLHENDAIIATPELTLQIEIKHLTSELHKNELLIFNQKGIDFLLSGNKSLCSKPFYRMVISGGILSPESRRFAIQWGIHCIEPDRLPLLLLHELAHYNITGLQLETPKVQDEICRVIPTVVTPIQSCIRQISGFLDEKSELLGPFQVDRVLNVIQREYGDEYWMILDEMFDTNWLEENYEKLNLELGLDEL